MEFKGEKMYFLIFLMMTERELVLKGPNQDQQVQALNFVLNSLSRNSIITKVVRNGDKVSFDLKDYDINPKNYDKFIKTNPYTIPRVDWFIKNSLNDYYNLLSINTLKDYKKLVSLDEKSPKQEAIVVDSGISRDNRKIIRHSTLLGCEQLARNLGKYKEKFLKFRYIIIE